MRAICTVIINTDKLLCIGRKIACTEPYNIIPAVAKARNKRIVGVKNKLSFGMNTILYGIVNPFRMTVSCELVTVKVCDNIMSRCDVFEGIFAKRSSLSMRRISDLTLPERVQLPRIRVVTPSIWLEPSLFHATFCRFHKEYVQSSQR